MAIGCVFYLPGEDCCEVLKVVGAVPPVASTRRALRARYCLSGRFLACPVFQRVERGLEAAALHRELADVVRDAEETTRPARRSAGATGARG